MILLFYYLVFVFPAPLQKNGLLHFGIFFSLYVATPLLVTYSNYFFFFPFNNKWYFVTFVLVVLESWIHCQTTWLNYSDFIWNHELVSSKAAESEYKLNMI